MESIGKVSQWVFDIGGTRLVVNSTTIIMTWVVIGLVLAFAWVATRGRGLIPGPWQQIAELLV
ncbi:MAG: F0F1 ATP synthase subunit A, partial [Syntrophobacteria bacterium]